MSGERDWYTQLGVPAAATKEDIETAVERMSRQASTLANSAPDRSQALRDKVRAIRADLLSGDDARRRYDSRVAELRASSRPANGDVRNVDQSQPAISNSGENATPQFDVTQPQQRTSSPSLPPYDFNAARPSIVDAVAANVAPVVSRFRRFLQSGWICPACSTEGSPEDEYCNSCGAAMKVDRSSVVIRCLQCSSKLDPGDRFCVSCGKPVPQG
ncbi:MAG: hypothetical protein HKL85_07390 [Acidimicrobiaceae bacterium]|nr:hypothetical protein [Acidimicrobiaceae bacterium]